MIQKSLFMKGLTLIVFAVLFSLKTRAQQDPQYTQYMYNTMSVNAGYAGQRDVLSATALYRTQWVGIDGAPKTLTFGIHSPLRNERIGLGLNVVSDQLGPASETSVDINASYAIPLDRRGDVELSFGLKAGFHSLDVNLSLENQKQGGDNSLNDFSTTSPTFGGGLYLHSNRWYIGAAVPNILRTEHYKNNGVQESIAVERLHYFLIGGYVFDFRRSDIKLKPAFLLKGVSGAPLIADLSVSALFNEKFSFGLAYRWDDSVSGLAGFQISPELFIGYAYDATTTALNNFNSGTHEIMLRFELQQISKILSPRFF